MMRVRSAVTAGGSWGRLARSSISRVGVFGGVDLAQLLAQRLGLALAAGGVFGVAGGQGGGGAGVGRVVRAGVAHVSGVAGGLG